jgi:hypothetical protein
MNRTRKNLSRAIVTAAACVAILAATASAAAAAPFHLSTFGTALSGSDGNSSRQAGAHADLTVKAEFGNPHVDGTVRDLDVTLPAGLVGNPTVVSTCGLEELSGGSTGVALCPSDSQVGIAVPEFGSGPAGTIDGIDPLYNLAPGPGDAAVFGFNQSGVTVIIRARVTPGDYTIASGSVAINQTLDITGVGLTFWGVPAEAKHDPQRVGTCGHGQITICTGRESSLPVKPFFTNPTSCPGSPVSFLAVADSWGAPGAFVTSSVSSDLSGAPFVFDGCGRLPFAPTLVPVPGTHRAHSPTGLGVELVLPSNEGPKGFSAAHVRKTVISFPPGMSVSPSAVAGLGACSEAEVGLGNNHPPACPDSAKLGNVSIDTQLLADPVEGEVVLATQNANPFGSTYAIYLLAKGPGFYLKLPGELNLDKQTGQLKVVFDDLPQLPFESVHLDFRGGPTAPLTTPDTCGDYSIRTEVTSWASPTPVVASVPMQIDEDCSGGGKFNPTLQAGVANPVAGAISPLTIRIRRQDGEQNVSRLDVTLPEGELAKLKGVEVCPDALAVTGNCGKGSQVGISTTAIGTGAFPLFVPQPGKDPTALYLAGPYKGAPYSLITKVPAQSGPFDFGMIVVRTAINVDPVTSQVIAKSDPLPQILEGVPIAYRDVRIEVQKPDFTVNPTSCEQRYVTTTISSIEGATAHPSAPFKVGDCASLGFAPKLAFKVRGGTNRGDYQALTATLTTHKHEANISRVAVTLPHSEFLAQEHIRTICTRVQFAAKNCPEGSIYGFAKATTPLLGKPLEGPVYLRSSSNPLPDLVATLNGQFDIELAGRIDSVNGGIRNTFEVVPDAPVSRFVLKMKGGEKSLLVNSRNLCKSTSKAEVRMIGQNGMRASSRPVVRNSCKGAAKSGHRAARR